MVERALLCFEHCSEIYLAPSKYSIQLLNELVTIINTHTHTHTIGTMLSLIYQIRKFRLQRVRCFAQGHTYTKCKAGFKPRSVQLHTLPPFARALCFLTWRSLCQLLCLWQRHISEAAGSENHEHYRKVWSSISHISFFSLPPSTSPILFLDTVYYAGNWGIKRLFDLSKATQLAFTGGSCPQKPPSPRGRGRLSSNVAKLSGEKHQQEALYC